MKILVTAFDPFGGDDTNSSMMVLEKLPERIGDIEIKKLLVPTVYIKSAETVISAANDMDCDAVVSLGQAGGRRAVTVEVIAVNYALSTAKDNDGVIIEGEKLCPDGENAIFATLPVKEMVEAARQSGFEVSLSASAGAFVCNSLLYLLLTAFPDKKVGFVHLPYAKEQGKEESAMTTDDLVRCVVEMLKVMDE